jgi:hypothetical protein
VIDYVPLENGALEYRRGIGGEHEVVLQASEIRRDRTGVHARLTVGLDSTILEEDTLNVARREDRNRLANAAHQLLAENLNGTAKTFDQAALRHELMMFSRGLWPAQVGSMTGERTAGDAELSSPSFIVDDYVLSEGGTLLFAPPGRGKSWIGLAMAVSVDAGIGSLWNVTQRPVLYLNLERGRESFARRLGLVNRVLGLPPERELMFIHARGKSLADVWDGAERTVKEEGVGLVVLDSLSRSGAGDLTENAPANRAMDLLNGMGCSWLALAHTPRADESHVYGSQMFDAACDLGVQMLTQDSPHEDYLNPTLGIGLRVAKANDTAKPALRIWALEFDRRFGLTGVRPARRNEFPEIEGSSQPRSVEAQVINLLLMRAMTNGELAAEMDVTAGYMSKITGPMKEDGKITEVRREGNSIYLGIPSRHGDSQQEFPRE